MPVQCIVLHAKQLTRPRIVAPDTPALERVSYVGWNKNKKIMLMLLRTSATEDS